MTKMLMAPAAMREGGHSGRRWWTSGEDQAGAAVEWINSTSEVLRVRDLHVRCKCVAETPEHEVPLPITAHRLQVAWERRCEPGLPLLLRHAPRRGGATHLLFMASAMNAVLLFR